MLVAACVQAMLLWASPVVWSDSSRTSSSSSNSPPSGQQHTRRRARDRRSDSDTHAGRSRPHSDGIPFELGDGMARCYTLLDRDRLIRCRFESTPLDARRSHRCCLLLLLSSPPSQCRFLDTNSAARRLRGQVRNLGPSMGRMGAASANARLSIHAPLHFAVS